MVKSDDIFSCIRSDVPDMDFHVYKLYGGRQDNDGGRSGKILYSIAVSGSVYA